MVYSTNEQTVMNDNQIISVDFTIGYPLENVLEKLLLDVSSAINMGHLMHLRHPSKYRNVLVLIRQMANEELNHLDRRVA
jgi:hypothetical protein